MQRPQGVPHGRRRGGGPHAKRQGGKVRDPVAKGPVGREGVQGSRCAQGTGQGADGRVTPTLVTGFSFVLRWNEPLILLWSSVLVFCPLPCASCVLLKEVLLFLP